MLDLIGFVSRLYPFLLWHNILGSLHACSPKYIHQIFTTEYWDLLMHVHQRASVEDAKARFDELRQIKVSNSNIQILKYSNTNIIKVN